MSREIIFGLKGCGHPWWIVGEGVWSLCTSVTGCRALVPSFNHHLPPAAETS